MKLVAGLLFLLLTLFIVPVSSAQAASPADTAPEFNIGNTQIQKRLYPVDGSGASGVARFSQKPYNSGTHITVLGFGLTPYTKYVSLYYANHTCAPELNSATHQIGAPFTATGNGQAAYDGDVKANLNTINSVGIVKSSTNQVAACRDIRT